jgi:hypothetical protein
MKAYEGVELNLHSLASALNGGERSGLRPQPLYPQGKEPPVPVGLGGPHNRSGSKKEIYFPCLELNPDSSAFQLIAHRYPDFLYR